MQKLDVVHLFILRISNLEKDLKKARKKEAEDTKALEDAVKMVEENLRKTTVRDEENADDLKCFQKYPNTLTGDYL